jgi:hypothetical protein
MRTSPASDRVDYWLRLADYDLATARALLTTRRYLYVGFMCHQVIEKTLKAAVVDRTSTVPPFIVAGAAGRTVRTPHGRTASLS